MLRLTISVNRQLAESFDRLVERKGYRNRSEAFRALVRRALQQDGPPAAEGAHCAACVSFVYNNDQRMLANRLSAIRQRFNGVTVSATHAPIQGAASMETLILRGEVCAVVRLADAIMAEAGVRHAHLNLVPIEAEHANACPAAGAYEDRARSS
jgi:CopG family nickel-responsive transcriptional regulator